MRIGCPAISRTEKGIVVNSSMCNGCGLCASYCKFDSIKKVGR